VLRAQLREMAGDDLVKRRTLSPRTAGVRYTLTPYGKTLGPVFESLWRWGTTHLSREGAERGTLVVPPRRAGEPTTPTERRGAGAWRGSDARAR